MNIRDEAIALDLLPDKWRHYGEEELYRIMNPGSGTSRRIWPKLGGGT